MSKDQDQSIIGKVIRYCQGKVGVDNFSAIVMFISSFMWPSAYIYANEHNLSFAITLIVRGFSVCIFSLVVCAYYGYPLSCKDPKCFRYLMIRCILMSFHGAVTAFSQFYLPLPIVHTVSSVGPVFGIIIDFFLHGAKMTRKQIYGVILSLIGVNLVLNGDIILSKINPDYHIISQFENYHTQSTFVMFLVSLLLVVCIACWAYAVILTKKVGMNSTQINFYAGMSMMVTGAIFTPSTTAQPEQLQVYLWAYVFMGLLFILTTATFSIAILYCENIGKILTVSNNIVFVSYLISVLKYNESVNPIGGVGSIILLVGISSVLLSKK